MPAINYDPSELPEVGDYMVDAKGEPHMVIAVNRAEGWFEVEGGSRTWVAHGGRSGVSEDPHE